MSILTVVQEVNKKFKSEVIFQGRVKYEQSKNKLDLATEMLQSLKKVATRRISENDFNNLNNMGYKENL